MWCPEIEKIGDEAFYGFMSSAGIKSISIPSTVTYAGQECFRCCGVKSIDIPANCQLGTNCLYGSSFTKVSFPGNIKTISRGVCAWAQMSEAIIPDIVENIDNVAFSQSSVKTISMPKNLKVIGSSAFSNTPITDDCLNFSEGLLILKERCFMVVLETHKRHYSAQLLRNTKQIVLLMCESSAGNNQILWYVYWS